MESNEKSTDFETLHLKSEVIPIEEDEFQSMKNVHEEPHENLNGGITTEFYYFEPQQQKTDFIVKAEDKTDNDKQNNSIKILCMKCSNVFENRVLFEVHYKKSHKDQPVVYACIANACGYNAKKFVLLRNHFKRHLVGRYQCNTSDCLNTYSQKSDLIIHKTTIHGLKVCRKCNLEFENAETFLEHKNSHTTTVASKTKQAKAADKSCPDCGKILQTPGGLFTHRKMHLEKPQYRCEVCQKEFFQKVNLLNHEKTHNIQNRNYNCSQCDKSFFEKSHLLRHQNFHSESRDFQCETCLKFYKTERCLKVHKQVHSDPSNRPFKCSVCQKGFLSSSKLKQHANIHTNSRPFLCKHCPRDFTNYPNLLKHTIRRHKVDHRTGKPLSKIPDYVTNKKKKKAPNNGRATEIPVASGAVQSTLCDEINVIKIPDDDLELPSTSGLIRGFQFSDDTNYDMSIMSIVDIDEFSDFQLLSPSKEYDSQDINDSEQFSIIDAADLQFFTGESTLHLVSSGQ